MQPQPYDDLHEEIVDEVVKNIRNQIDWGIVRQMLEDTGWYYVQARPSRYDILTWVNENCVGDHTRHEQEWMFELEQDAVLFTLRWA